MLEQLFDADKIDSKIFAIDGDYLEFGNWNKDAYPEPTIFNTYGNEWNLSFDEVEFYSKEGGNKTVSGASSPLINPVYPYINLEYDDFERFSEHFMEVNSEWSCTSESTETATGQTPPYYVCSVEKSCDDAKTTINGQSLDFRLAGRDYGYKVRFDLSSSLKSMSDFNNTDAASGEVCILPILSNTDSELARVGPTILG